MKRRNAVTPSARIKQSSKLQMCQAEDTLSYYCKVVSICF